MAVYNQTSINYEFVKVRWQEPYVSSAVNRKFFGIFPKGVYSGFVITPAGLRSVNVGPGSVSGGLGTGMTGPGYVSGGYDESVGWSIAVHQDTQGHSSTVAIAPGMLENYQLDCTGLDGQRVYVALDVQYSISATTAAQIKLLSGSEIDANPSMIVLGFVDVPSNPLDPIDSVDIGYNDPIYPRLTPLSTPQRAGLMPASAWAQLEQEKFPWQDLVSADRDPFNNFVIQITPSQKVTNNRRIFTYVQANISSKFPRSATGEYNGGVGNDQPTNLNLQTGVIGGAHQIPTNLSFTTPSVVGTPSSFQTGLVCIDPSDNIQVFYSAVQASEVLALLDDNFPIAGKKLFQVCMFLAKTDGAGALLPLDTNDIYDRRPFLNLGGGAGGDANELLERYKDQLQDSVYNYVTPSVFSVDEDALIDTTASTGSFSIVDGTFDMVTGEFLQTKQLLGTEILAEAVDVPQVDLVVTYASTAIDTAATYQISRDGGANFQTASFERLGDTETFNSTHSFDDSLEVNISTLADAGASPTTTETLTASVTKIAQAFTLTETVTATVLELQVNKVGSPAGSILLQIVKDNAGTPSSNLNDLLVSSASITAGSISAGNSTVSVSIPRTVLAAGTYHLVVVSDGLYQASYSVGVTQLSARVTSGGSLPALKTFSVSSWTTVAGEKMNFAVKGNPLELVLKVTASASAKIAGIAAYYDLAGEFSVEPLQREVKTIAASTNPSTFTIQSFVPNEKLLSVVEVESGKLYVAPFFTVDGQDVIFPAGVFNSLTPITLVFKQEQKAVAVTTVVQQGGSQEGGAKNYIQNPKFETSTSSWSLFNTTLTSKIPTGSITSGAASLDTFGFTSASPLEGVGSLRVASSGAVTAGHGFISDAFTIDREDQAKVMGFSFAYETVSGTMNFSGTSSNTWAVYIYDVSGAAWIQPAGVYNLTQGSGIGLASGTFQTTATGTQYRIAVLCVTATSGAVEMRFDDFQLGPQRVVYGAPVTDWQSFTPTVSGISGTMTGKWRRVGDSAEFEMALTTSGTASGTITVSVTSAFAFDYTKLPVSSFANIGSAAANDGTGIHLGTCFTDDTSTNSFFISGDDGQNIWNATVPFTWSGTRTVSFSVKVPLAGLSSSVQMSQDTDTRVVAARLYRSANQTSVNTNNSFVKIAFESTSFDTHGSAVLGSNRWVAPISGYYSINAAVRLSGANLLAANYGPAIYIDGSPVADSVTSFTAGVSQDINVSTLQFLNAGQYVEAYVYGAGNNSVNTYQFDGGSRFTYLTIERISGPATIAASETVAARYTSSGGQLISDNTYTRIDFANKVFDTTSSVTTGASWAFTAPISGKYQVNSKVTVNYVNDTSYTAIKIQKNLSDYSVSQRFWQASGAGAVFPSVAVISDIVECVAGDTITIWFLQNTAGARNLTTTASENTVSIVRVGN